MKNELKIRVLSRRLILVGLFAVLAAALATAGTTGSAAQSNDKAQPKSISKDFGSLEVHGSTGTG